jgi:hypothetical protein
LVSVAKVIQAANEKSVEKEIARYERQGWDNGKLFLLQRVIFDLPESIPQNKTIFFNGWITVKMQNPDGTMNQAWPIKWNSGHPILIEGYLGEQDTDDKGYSALEEFRYFRTHYLMRDLSKFQ